MANCRVTKKNTTCGTKEEKHNIMPDCPAFSVCLPFGQQLHWNGQCFEITGRVTISDGWYSSFLVENGCITDAKEADIPIYTPAPCADAPTACDDNAGCTCDIKLNPEAGNILTYNNDLLDGHIYVGQNTGITVSGAGTANDPLVFKVDSVDTSVYLKSGTPDVLTITGDGSQVSPYDFEITKAGISAGWYGAFNVDIYGRIIGYDSSRETSFKGVTDSATITMTNTEGLISADLIKLNTNGQLTLGGITVTIDQYGRVAGSTRNITVPADVYTLGDYNVTLNEYGNVTKIEPATQEDAAIPLTFTASYKGIDGSTDTDRLFTFTMQKSGPVAFEYRGNLGVTTLAPGISMTAPAGFTANIDGANFIDISCEIVGYSGNNHSIVAVRGVTSGNIAVGQHTITLEQAVPVIQTTDGWMRVDIVGKGA